MSALERTSISASESAPFEGPEVLTSPEPPTPDIPIITCLFTGECASVSGRSTLTYEIGRHPDQSLHLRIATNSGGGMFCAEWASGDRINAVVMGVQELTSRSFNALHPGKSINTGGFVMAVLKDLGLIRANEENTRLHEHVPTTTFQQVAMDRIGSASAEPASKPGRRKGKGAD